MLPFDLHTHSTTDTTGQALCNLSMDCLTGIQTLPDHLPPHLSAGIHPCYEGNWQEALIQLQQLAESGLLHAIGECGIDHRSSVPLSQQLLYLRSQALLARRHHLPLIIHCVKGWPELLTIRELHDTGAPVIVHGFRGKPTLAQQLLRAGFHLSFGLKCNQQSLTLCPHERRWAETDDEPQLTLQEVLHAHEQLASHPLQYAAHVQFFPAKKSKTI